MNRRLMIKDRQIKERYICARIPDEGVVICMVDGNGDYPPTIANLRPYRDPDDGSCELEIETDDPENVNLDTVYKHFRWQEMTYDEKRREVLFIDPVTLRRDQTAGRIAEHSRKVKSLSETQLELFNAVSETVPLRAEALAGMANLENERDSHIRGCLSVLAKLGIIQKVKEGYLKVAPPIHF